MNTNMFFDLLRFIAVIGTGFVAFIFLICECDSLTKFWLAKAIGVTLAGVTYLLAKRWEMF